MTSLRAEQQASTMEHSAHRPSELSRRQAIQVLGALGIGSSVFQRALAAQAEQTNTVTAEMIRQAEWIAGLQLSEEERKAAAQGLQQILRDCAILRKVKLDNSVPPALVFHPAPLQPPGEHRRGTVGLSELAAPKRPDSPETLAFMPVSKLATLLRTGQLSAVELTKLSLERLRQYDPTLHCVVSYTEETALKQAERA